MGEKRCSSWRGTGIIAVKNLPWWGWQRIGGLGWGEPGVNLSICFCPFPSLGIRFPKCFHILFHNLVFSSPGMFHDWEVGRKTQGGELERMQRVVGAICLKGTPGLIPRTWAVLGCQRRPGAPNTGLQVLSCLIATSGHQLSFQEHMLRILFSPTFHRSFFSVIYACLR